MNEKNDYIETTLFKGIEIAEGIEYGGCELYAQEKINARMKLLSMEPLAAQELVNMTLYPQYWRVNDEDLTWDESIPSCYGDSC